MKVWLLKDGENLPVQEDASPMRMWMLADALRNSGHDVTWWSSTHSHQRKTLLYDHDHSERVAERFDLMLLFAGAYKKNRSMKRLVHHRRLGRRFLEEAEERERPDVIVVSFPILELVRAAILFGRRHDVPVVVDVRDPWPDALVNLLPRWLQVLAQPGVVWMHRVTGKWLGSSNSLVACSDGFLEWALKLARRPRQSSDRVLHLGRPGRKPGAKVEAIGSDGVREKLGVDDGCAIVTFVGSFGHVYDLETVCAAASKVWESGVRNVRFVLAGDGVKFDRIKALSESLENVTLTGWLGSSEVSRLLSISDVGLAPCIQLPGCLPNKISEYGAAGVPIVSSLEGDMVELLDKYNAGFSYPHGDAEALCDCVLQIARSRSVRAEQRRGISRMFAEHFDADRIYPEFVSHIERAAGSSGEGYARST